MYRNVPKNYFESHLGGYGSAWYNFEPINKKTGNRFHFQWHRRRVNNQFSNCVTDKVNGSSVQPSLFGEDQRPDPRDGGNRAYCSTKAFVFYSGHPDVCTDIIMIILIIIIIIIIIIINNNLNLLLIRKLTTKFGLFTIHFD